MEVRMSRKIRSKGMRLWALLPPAIWMALEVTSNDAFVAKYLALAPRTARWLGVLPSQRLAES